MGKKKNANRELTHEEIWDDSALVRSWDEAVEEYKLYHSIHAKGENVEDVLRQAEAEAAESAQDEGLNYAEAMETGDAELEAPLDGEDESAARVPSNEVKQTAEDESQAASSTAQPVPEAGDEHRATGPAPAGAGGAAMPHMLLGQVQDEGLKNLMMAWYYAGYYTGLYEGQQRANQRANK
ncbi:hypothetical protein VTN00DRAFT_1466 [Thermoascus crustaceus]|uniref:uncharacterized protein n=1 Tax=Thermoascus crustaceus TaxID=5088 RepID=UPI00374457EC